MAGTLAVVGSIDAQAAKPSYLGYAEFAPDDTAQAVALKQAYNRAAQRYNQALYEYLVTLDAHDRLVDAHNASHDPAAKKQARDAAQPLRAKLADLRRQVTSRAAAVDEAARRAAAGGVVIEH